MPSAVAEQTRIAAIRTLNDRLRQTGLGGKTVVTPGSVAQSDHIARSIYNAVANFSAFTTENDPHGEHDCAVVDVQGIKVIWKIDYFDRSMTAHSPDPADPKVTIRVL